MRYIELFETITAYHGSGNEHQGFNTKHIGHNSHTFGSYDSERHGIFFSLNPEFAAMYGDVIEYKLNINNTLNLDNSLDEIYYFTQQEDLDRGVMQDAQGILHSGRDIWQIFDDEVGEEFINYLKEKGYDSVIFTEYNEDDNGQELESKTIVVFNPSKAIKYGQLEMDLYEAKG